MLYGESRSTIVFVVAKDDIWRHCGWGFRWYACLLLEELVVTTALLAHCGSGNLAHSDQNSSTTSMTGGRSHFSVENVRISSS